MKKVIFLSVILTFMCFAMQAQREKIFPIPSFKVAIDSGFARFQENIPRNEPNSSREKRNIYIKVYTNIPIIQNCQAQVWVYSLDGLDTLGPYTVMCGGTLVVEIDEREWGVLVQSNSSILTDVWIE